MAKKPASSKKTRVLFYTSIPRAFRTTLIGYLYELSQFCSVVLLSEELDKETEEIVRDRKLFPGLEKIIPVRQYTGKRKNIFSRNRYFYNLAKKTIKNEKPDLVVAANDVFPFELYLMRMAKRCGAKGICFQAALFSDAESVEERSLWLNLINAHTKTRIPLPFPLKMLATRIKKYLGHFIYYWLMPLFVFEVPFLGKASFILMPENCLRIRLKDASFYVVFSQRDFQFMVDNGFEAQKLLVFGHGLAKEKNRKLFKKLHGSGKFSGPRNSLTFLWPEIEIGFRKEGDEFILIDKEKTLKHRTETLSLIAKTLKSWKIFVKPHPSTPNISNLSRILKEISPTLEIVNPSQPVDKYIEASRAVVGIPPVGTTLPVASLQNPGKMLISLNLEQEFLGDSLTGFEGIEQINDRKRLVKVLDEIKENRYRPICARKTARNHDFKGRKFESMENLVVFLAGREFDRKAGK